jgi:hypothetical protein
MRVILITVVIGSFAVALMGQVATERRPSSPNERYSYFFGKQAVLKLEGAQKDTQCAAWRPWLVRLR